MTSWEDIPGWFDFGSVYFEQVQRAKEGARFVEVGAFLGRSSAYMAQKIKESGKKVEFFVVDTWKGSPNRDQPYNSFDCTEKGVAKRTDNLKGDFMTNMAACGVLDLVTPIQRPSVEAARLFDDESLDFVFIDGDHEENAVFDDLCAWWPKLKPGGLLAGHDFDQQGPKKAVLGFVSQKGLAHYGDGPACSQFGYHCFGIPKPIKEPVRILLGLPNYDGTAYARGVMRAAAYAYSGVGETLLQEQSISLLADNFNTLWTKALNEGFTHFAMLHADILPPMYWLDILMHELNALGAQMVSTVVPLKDGTGVTSTGIRSSDSPWTPFRRFTMREIMGMPATFNAEQAGYPGENLVLNTGCWMADLRDGRWKAKDASGGLYCYFQIRNRITHEGEAGYVAWCEPEDFFFSNRVQDLGMKAVATRKVQLEHIGAMRFRNDQPLGTWDVDEATRPLWDNPQLVGV